MPFTARIFRILESELNQRLSFSYEVVGPKHGPTILLEVCIRNDSALSLRNIRGTIAPLSSVRFQPTVFSLPGLGPGQSLTVARIHAVVRTRLTSHAMFDQVATVDVTSQADLSSFSFHDTRALTYSPRPGIESPAFGSSRRGASNDSRPSVFRDQAIPLSK